MTDVHTSAIIIFGLGREGLSTTQYLLSKDANSQLLLLDEKPLEQLDPAWKEIVAKQGVSFTQELPEHLDGVTVYCSPGIPPHNPIMQQLSKSPAKLSSNVELFCEVLASQEKKIVTIGVTGTKGKSTTSALLYHLLKTAKLPAHYAGNVGIPALSILSDILAEPAETVYVVLELSSHQLSMLSTSPNIAVLQNIVPEHLDYYGSFEDYVAAKAHIALHQSESDHIIYSLDFASSTQVAEQSKAEKHAFSLDNPQANQLSQRVISTLDAAQPKLLGNHNRYNMAPSVIVAEILGIEPAVVRTALNSFEPLSHRLEKVETGNDDILYINDSLATTPEATIAAIEAFPHRQIILIAGGYDRSLDFFELAKKIATTKTIKAIILFPPTGEKIVEFIHKIQADAPILETGYFKVETMSEAVATAKKIARKGDVVLMSPAAASFGRFRDYADRGNQFIRNVQGS